MKRKNPGDRSMYKKTLLTLKLTLTLAALILTSVNAFAAAKGEVVLSKDGRMISRTNGTHAVTRVASSDSGLVTIFDNIGKAYPKGTYWCCEGYSITGPNASPLLPEYWLAVAFTPSANHTVTKMEVAIGHFRGKNELVLSLYNDVSGLPGTAMKTWQMTGLPVFGSCCTVETKGDAAGIPVTAGTQYWVVVSTVGDNSDTFADWNVEDIDQVDTYTVPVAYYCSNDQGGGNCGNNDAWTLDTSSGNQGPAFAVLGR
jgi:hypothetical protein